MERTLDRYLQIGELSPSTKKSCRSIIGSFQRYTKRYTNGELTPCSIIKYLFEMGKNVNSPAYYNMESNLVRYYGYMTDERRNFSLVDLVRGILKKEMFPEPTSFLCSRNRAILFLIAGTEMTFAEILYLHDLTFMPKKKKLHIWGTGKDIPLTGEMTEAIEQYWEFKFQRLLELAKQGVRYYDISINFFINERGKTLQANTIREIIYCHLKADRMLL